MDHTDAAFAPRGHENVVEPPTGKPRQLVGVGILSGPGQKVCNWFTVRSCSSALIQLSRPRGSVNRGLMELSTNGIGNSLKKSLGPSRFQAAWIHDQIIFDGLA